MERSSAKGDGFSNYAKIDRRSHSRFPLTMQLRYATSRRDGTLHVGAGRTIDLSSSGLSFVPDNPLFPGERLEVSIDWPVLLEGDVKLQLVIYGVVVRTDEAVVAMEIQKHEFKTRRVGTRLRQLGDRSA